MSSYCIFYYLEGLQNDDEGTDFISATATYALLVSMNTKCCEMVKEVHYCQWLLFQLLYFELVHILITNQ